MIAEQTEWLDSLLKSPNYQKLKEGPIAYFCAEYAISDELPIYAGGLGILAGDYLREAEDRDIPIVAVGLYYSQGFTRTELSPEGKVVDVHDSIDPEQKGLSKVLDTKGSELRVRVMIQDREVEARIWQWEPPNLVGDKTVKLYLLDTNLVENDPVDQHITDTLYINDKELRFKQEIILGIGGYRALQSMGHKPSFYHLNEGHSALLTFELVKNEMKEKKVSFDKAMEAVCTNVLFTNHTLVPAGNDVFSNDLVSLLLFGYAREIGVPVQKLIEVGLVQQSSTFSMTMLAMRMSGKINGVSKLHSEKASEIWKDHPMFPITNGVHIPTWDKVKDEATIWEKHKERKRKLLEYISNHTGVVWDERAIVLGWARRIVRYKRPLALVERLKRFGELARDSERPIHVVFAGLSHPADNDGKDILEELRYRLSSDLKGVAVYLPHYNMELSGMMTSGCDVWLNTPIVGYEACGTSGMKAALNGVLPLSTIDGWLAEIEMLGIGWGLDNDNITVDLLDKLEDEVLPLYYGRNEHDIPEDWVKMMKSARSLIYNDFSMTKTLREYMERGVGLKIG